MSSTNNGPAQTTSLNLQPLTGAFDGSGKLVQVYGPGGVSVPYVDPNNVSIGGGVIALPVASPSLFFDNFSRTDTSAGDLGAVPGYGTYTLLGTNALAAATDGRVSNGRFVTTGASVVYATQNLRAPVNRIGAKIAWTTGNGGGNAGTHAFLITPDNSAPGLIANSAIHVTVTRSQFVIGYIASQVITSLNTFVFPATLSLNTDYVADFQIDGNTLFYNVAGVVGQLKLPIMASITFGNYATWEHYYAGSSVSETCSTGAVWAGAANPVGRSGLLDLCVAAWRFKDTNFLDSSGQGHAWTNNGAATVGTGSKFPSSVTLASASSQFLSQNSHSDFVLTGKDWTWVFWYTPATLPAGGSFHTIINKGSTASMEYTAFIDSTGKVNAIVSPSGSTSSGSVTVINNTALVAGTPAMIAIRYNSANTRLGVSINGGAYTQQVASGLFSGASIVRLGFASYLGTAYANGKFDAVALFSSPPGHGGALSPENLIRLYKDGDWLEFPF